MVEGGGRRSHYEQNSEDDTSIFSAVKEKDEAAASRNQNLEKLNLWAWQWKSLTVIRRKR